MWDTRFKASTILLPFGSFVGLTEKLEEIDPTELARDLNGGVVVFRPLWNPKWRVSLAASGPAVRWAPAFARIRRGDPVTIQCITPQTDVILPGQTTVIVNRRIVPGSVRARLAFDEEEYLIPVSVDGQAVTIDAPRNAPVSVTWRMELDAVLASRALSMPEIEGRLDWTMSFEEA